MNNLYGWAMSEYLPYSEFNWLKMFDEFDVMWVSKKNEIGYFLEVDLEYPDILRKLHNDCPLAPQKLAVSSDMLWKYCKEIAGEYKVKVGDVKKLIPNLASKAKYMLHYKSIQCYLSLGIKLTKIHRVLKLKQSDLMKKYIDFNSKKRKNAVNDFYKYFFEKMVNSVYGGKMIENLRKRINVRLVNNVRDFVEYTSRPTYFTHKPILMLNKPIYVGFTVSDLSKWKMYEVHYNFIKRILRLNCWNAEMLT